MRKSELRTKFRKYEALTRERMRSEEAIIEALPASLEVTKVKGSAPKLDGSIEDGMVEVECEHYGEALNLCERFRQLTPTPLASVESERTPGHKVTSFVPLCRIPAKWRESSAVWEVFPVLLQLAPSDDPMVPRVTLEWYAEVRNELILNVRATVKRHPVVWRGHLAFKSNISWPGISWPGAPSSDYERVVFNKHHKTPFVTLWWQADLERVGGFYALLSETLTKEGRLYV